MKGALRALAWLSLLAVVSVLALGLHTWYGRPLSFDWFLERVLYRSALEDPELLSALRLLEPYGLKNHNGRLTDVSVQKQLELALLAREHLAMLGKYRREDLSEPRQLSYDIVQWALATQVEGERWMFHDYPVNPLFGIQSELPVFMATQHVVASERDARHYLRRLAQFDDKFAQLLDGLRLREERGVIPPHFAVVKVIEQMQAFADTPVTQNILYTAFEQKLRALEDLSDEQRGRLLAQARQRIETIVYPAYDRLVAYFERLQRKARFDYGVWALPDGAAYYAFRVREETTTDLSPTQIHLMGRSEVSRIEAQMDAILRAQGLTEGSVGARMAALGRDPRFTYPDSDEGRAQCLADFKRIVEEIGRGLEPYFARRPRAGVEVERIPAFKEQTSPRAYYEPPPLDGSRPGRFWVNLRSVGEIKKFGMRTLAYHEAVPGHHWQIALAQEQPDIPTLQKTLQMTAYVEGWALYAERLASEIGYTRDPFDDLGRLRAELFRSVRLVVDTGLHQQRWSREQAIAYMAEKTGMPEADVVAEVERYLVWPGQALAYKIGMMKLLELRERARRALGPKFDLREFHDQVLAAGPMPLAVLDARIDAWIGSKP